LTGWPLLNEAESGDLELMLTKEAGVMTDLLRRAGDDLVLTSVFRAGADGESGSPPTRSEGRRPRGG
jgi:hypothetical protein